MVDYVSKVKDLVKAHKFLQFSASWCPDCVYANSIWKKFGVENKIHIFDIGSLPASEQQQWRNAFQVATGSRNLPTIIVNGSFWGTESELHRFESKGTLQQELTKIGILE